MAAWITTDDVTAVYPDCAPIAAVIAHVQALAETTIGAQTTVPAGLKAVMVDMVRRFTLAATVDDNVSQEAIGGYSYSVRSRPGEGLTNHEKGRLRQAVGIPPFATLTMTRGPVETPPRSDRLEDDWLNVPH